MKSLHSTVQSNELFIVQWTAYTIEIGEDKHTATMQRCVAHTCNLLFFYLLCISVSLSLLSSFFVFACPQQCIEWFWFSCIGCIVNECRWRFWIHFYSITFFLLSLSIPFNHQHCAFFYNTMNFSCYARIHLFPLSILWPYGKKNQSNDSQMQGIFNWRFVINQLQYSLILLTQWYFFINDIHLSLYSHLFYLLLHHFMCDNFVWLIRWGHIHTVFAFTYECDLTLTSSTNPSLDIIYWFYASYSCFISCLFTLSPVHNCLISQPPLSICPSHFLS